jgi:hypothetical protein
MAKHALENGKSVTTNLNLTNSFGGGSRPNYTPGCSKQINGSAVSKLGGWFNTSCFTQAPAFTFGNESRNDGQLRAPGIANCDTAAVKRFPIKSEAAYVQFRVEAFYLIGCSSDTLAWCKGLLTSASSVRHTNPNRDHRPSVPGAYRQSSATNQAGGPENH